MVDRHKSEIRPQMIRRTSLTGWKLERTSSMGKEIETKRDEYVSSFIERTDEMVCFYAVVIFVYLSQQTVPFETRFAGSGLTQNV